MSDPLVSGQRGRIEPDDAPDSFDVEYRVKVIIHHDLQNGLRAGDEFEPLSPTMNRATLIFTLNWWREQGHTATLQKRVARTTYETWKATE